MGLELKRVYKQFNDFSVDVSFRVLKNETLVLVGPSGCGKTTVLRLIAGLIEADSGVILFDDQDLTELPAWKRRFALVFQEPALFPHLTVAANIGYGPFIEGKRHSERKNIINKQLTAVRLERYAKRNISSLSGGERQRVALARALAANPRLLLLDEPFSSLDGPLRRELWAEFINLRSSGDFPCLLVTHDRDEATQLGSRIALMREGRIIEQGTRSELLFAPQTGFAAKFFNTGNILAVDSSVLGPDGRFNISIGPHQFCAAGQTANLPALFIPYDALYILPNNHPEICFRSVITDIAVLGSDAFITALSTTAQTLRFRLSARDLLPRVNDFINLGIHEDYLRIIDNAPGLSSSN